MSSAQDSKEFMAVMHQIIKKSYNVVLLGAGASYAACPEDKNGKSLPLMGNLAETVGIEEVLKEFGWTPGQNFEEIYIEDDEKRNSTHKKIRSYFEGIEIPDTATIYDFLVLALDENDLLASFNWDPLLSQAWERNREFAQRKLQRELPTPVFLHGSVAVGYCKQYKVARSLPFTCPVCKEDLKPCPLLFPEKGDDGALGKDYGKNSFIKSEWDVLKNRMERCGLLTILGYSLPGTDAGARERIKEVWLLHKKQGTDWVRDMDVVNPDEEAYKNWKEFRRPSENSKGAERYLQTNHLDWSRDFKGSFIARYPMRIQEARIASIEGDWGCAPLLDAHLKIGIPLPEFHQWFEELPRSQNK